MEDVFNFAEVVEVDERCDGVGEGIDVRSCHVDGGAWVGGYGERAGAGEVLRRCQGGRVGFRDWGCTSNIARLMSGFVGRPSACKGSAEITERRNRKTLKVA